jgi:nucleoid-associated protein YgaU
MNPRVFFTRRPCAHNECGAMVEADPDGVRAMSRTPDNKRSNPIARAFSKFLERGDVSEPTTPKSQATSRAAPNTAPAAQPKSATTQPQRNATASHPLAGAAGTSARPAASAQPAAQTDAATARSRAATSAGATTPTAKATPRTYTVAKGDSLSKIAQQVYGRADRWKLIFEANRDKIRDPDLIQPGQVLVLPDAPTLH